MSHLQCFYVIVPTAPPDLVNTTSINPYVISLQWEPPPPVHQNGIIQYYIVHVSETNTGRFWTFYSVDPSLLVSALHPYYLYEFDVAAITIGTGPFASVTVQTEEARKLFVLMKMDSELGCLVSLIAMQSYRSSVCRQLNLFDIHGHNV